MAYKVIRSSGFLSIRRMRKDRANFMIALGRESVDICALQFGNRKIFIANHPDLVRDVLVTNDWNFIKGRGLRVSKPVLGEGLLTSEGEVHRRQRRLVQPSFHSTRLATYAQTMVRCSVDANKGWAAGEKIAMEQEMSRLTLRIVGLTLFSAELEGDAGPVGAALAEALAAFGRINSPLAMFSKTVRGFANRRAARARETMRAVLEPIIAAHREHPEQYDDMLSMLIESSEGPSGFMSDELLLDESLTLFLAGHETTAMAMTWAWFLLAQHTEVMEKLLAEIDEVLGGREPEMQDLPRLAYTHRVFREVLRMYPPAWFIVREAQTAYRMGDVDVPAGAQVAVSPLATQYDPRFWDAPQEFRPERWETITTDRNGFAYFPFAAGTRNCIGENFAMMEGVLLIATLAQRTRFTLLPHQKVEMWPQLTLRPRHSIFFRAEPR